MKTDTYTKIVLTVIAASLLWSDLAMPRVAKAQGEQRVVITGIDVPGKMIGEFPVYLTKPVEGCK